MNRILKSAAEGFLTLLYPPRCPFCDRIPMRGYLVCSECADKIPYIEPPVCEKCGRPVLAGDPLCDDCLGIGHSFESGEGLLHYNDFVKPAVYSLKYRGRADVGRTFGRLLFEKKKDHLREWQIDLIVPVPVHPTRLRARGYNQAEVIARSLAGAAGIEVSTKAVMRKSRTKALKELTKEERRSAMLSAFEPGCDVSGRKVLIVDDIYTSGATVDAVAAVLKEQGAASIRFLAVCIEGAFMVKYQ